MLLEIRRMVLEWEVGSGVMRVESWFKELEYVGVGRCICGSYKT